MPILPQTFYRGLELVSEFQTCFSWKTTQCFMINKINYDFLKN